jgi:hypothetical protein
MSRHALLQFVVFRAGLRQDWIFRIRVLADSQEILIGRGRSLLLPIGRIRSRNA